MAEAPPAAALEAALARTRAWLEGLARPPLARWDGPDGPPAASDVAVAAAAWAWRRVAPLDPPPRSLASWLAAGDLDGWPATPDAPADPSPPLAAAAFVWTERRVLLGQDPPASLAARILASRGPDGAFATAAAAPGTCRVDHAADDATQAAVLAWLGATGRRDRPAEVRLARALRDAPTGALAALARRAHDLGGPPVPAALPAPPGADPFDAALLAGDPGPLLAAQAPDGTWPWRPAPFPVAGAGRALGAVSLATALAVDALARAAGWPVVAPGAGAGPVDLRRRSATPWEPLVGEIVPGVSLVARDHDGVTLPALVSAAGTLPVEIGPRRRARPYFRTQGAWAVSYLGDRAPLPVEVAALEALVARLDASGHAPPPASVEATRVSELVSVRPDAADLRGLVALARPGARPIPVRLAPRLHLPLARPQLARALEHARARHVPLAIADLPLCGLPDARELALHVPEAVGRRPAREACDRCVVVHRCPGPAGGPLHPFTSETPWIPLRRAASAWADRWGHPGRAVLAGWWDALHDLPTGPLAGTRWRVDLALAAEAGRVVPGWRLEAEVEAGDAVGPVGPAVLARLPGFAPAAGPGSDPEALARLLAREAGDVLPAPWLLDGPAGPRVGAALQVGERTPREAWALVRGLAAALGLALRLPARLPPVDRVLCHVAADGAGRLALRVHADRPGGAAWTVPPELRADGGPGEALVELDLRGDGVLTPRAHLLPWWSVGGGADALAGALRLGARDAAILEELLDQPGFTLVPRSLGVADARRHAVLRVQ